MPSLEGENMPKLIALLLLAFSISAIAANNEAQQSIKEISKEIAIINRHLIELYQIQESQAVRQNFSAIAPYSQKKSDRPVINKASGLTQDAFEVAIENTIKELYSLKKKYDGNQYIRIAGFDINISIPPSVTVKLDFN